MEGKTDHHLVTVVIMLRPSTLSVRAGRVLNRSMIFLVLESTPFLWQAARTMSATSLLEVLTSKLVMPSWYWASGLLERKSDPLRRRPVPRIRSHLPPVRGPPVGSHLYGLSYSIFTSSSTSILKPFILNPHISHFPRCSLVSRTAWNL